MHEQSQDDRHALWAASFVDWSQSEFGYYVDRHWNEATQEWDEGVWQPVVWSPTQVRIFRWAFTRGTDGRLPIVEFWNIDTAKSGKTTLGAALAQWVGMYDGAKAEIQIAANSFHHAGIRGYKMLIDSLEAHPQGTRIATGLKSELTFIKTQNIVRPVPRKAGTISGGSPPFRWIDEIWDYEGDSARRMVAELKESPTRNQSLLYVSSYPPFEGDDSVLGDQLSAFFNRRGQPRPGVERVPGLEDLPVWVDWSTGTALHWNHDPYPWHLRVDAKGYTFLERQRRAYEQRHMLNEYLRIWEARIVSREDALIPEERWDACTDEDFAPLGEHERDQPLVVGVDLGYKGDSSAAVARAWNPVAQRYELRTFKIWEPGFYAGDDPANLLLDVQAWLYDLHRRQQVLAVYFDPTQAALMAAQLQQAGVKMVEVTQNNTRVVADTAYRQLILSGALRNYPQSAALRSHVLHAVAMQRNNGTIRMDKRKTSLQIDAAVADSMACYGVLEHKAAFERALRRAIRPPRRRPKRTTYGDVFRLGAGYGR